MSSHAAVLMRRVYANPAQADLSLRRRSSSAAPAAFRAPPSTGSTASAGPNVVAVPRAVRSKDTSSSPPGPTAKVSRPAASASAERPSATATASSAVAAAPSAKAVSVARRASSHPQSAR